MKDLKNIFDTHSHYDAEQFGGKKSAYALIGSLFENGLAGLIHASTDFESLKFGLRLSEDFPRAYASVGLHPEYASSFGPEDVEKLRGYAASSKKVVAVGEIGLDYHYEGYDRGAQISLFRGQVELANSLGLPVIVHCRNATEDCLEILKELRPRGVMHCFSGSWETAKEILNVGMYLGFTGVLTFKNAKKAVETVKNMPADRLLLETDCPYMAPEPHRGEISHSGLIPYIAERAAQIRGVEYDEIAAQTLKNAEELFNIK